MTSAHPPTTKPITDSTERTQVLALRIAPPKSAVARFGVARRFVNALMRSLAAPHF